MTEKKGRQMRIADDELELIKATFKGNDRLLKLMRKVFLPEYDPDAPLGEVIDLWMTVDLNTLTEQEREIRIRARNEVILHVEQQLMQLQSLANRDEKTWEELQEAMKKDSAR